MAFSLSDFLPFLGMVVVQSGYSGMNIISKLALDDGFSPFVLVTYRQVFATLATAPFVVFLERKTIGMINLPILFQVFLCSITGAFMNQVFYFIGLKYSTPTIACALTNLLPALTFVFAVLFRQEVVGIKTKPGLAKVFGTLICVGGAMLLSFYHGANIIGNSSIHWEYAQNMSAKSSSNKSNFFLGPFLLFASTAAWAIWFIIQNKLSKKFPAPYTTTTLMSLMASFECAAVGAISNHHAADWSLKSSVRLIASVYSGVVCSALAFCIMSLVVDKKGPLYTSVFTPLLLVITAILSWALLQEKLYLGTLLGSLLIIAGLYSVLWGKDKEMKQMNANEGEVEPAAKYQRRDLELQADPK